MPGPLSFEITHRLPGTPARTGVVSTPHGQFSTPAFMPVGTKGTIKGLFPHLVASTGSEIILNNAYHLLLRPGDDLVARRGGMHGFMGWDGPILTDSGGFQAFSMADVNRIDDDGVTFKSIIDGSSIHLGPERSMEIQNNLGADIIMAFDDCPPSVDGIHGTGESGYARRLEQAVRRTTEWLHRCIDAHAPSRDPRTCAPQTRPAGPSQTPSRSSGGRTTRPSCRAARGGTPPSAPPCGSPRTPRRRRRRAPP